MFALEGKRIYIAGHQGMVGSAIARRLGNEPCQVLVAPRSLDLRDQRSVREWFAAERPDALIIAAAKVGGILANASYPAQFLYDNLMIEANLIDAARDFGVAKLLFLGSSCIYPKHAPQPITEEALLTGPLEPTNQWYAIAKITGTKLCQAFRAEYGCDFISAMPSNLYGPGDNFDLDSGHVLPALIRKAHEAKREGRKSLQVWGSGTPMREFLYVDDLADACVFLLKNYSEAEHVNVGSGEEASISQLAQMVAQVVGFDGTLEFDRSKPDGTPRKILDSSKLERLGWRARTSLRDGIAASYRAFLAGQMKAP